MDKKTKAFHERLIEAVYAVVLVGDTPQPEIKHLRQIQDALAWLERVLHAGRMLNLTVAKPMEQTRSFQLPSELEPYVILGLQEEVLEKVLHELAMCKLEPELLVIVKARCVKTANNGSNGRNGNGDGHGKSKARKKTSLELPVIPT